jgi:bifunctional ADP-heptose synthase (sugar kinase/adenylyltransferase)
MAGKQQVVRLDEEQGGKPGPTIAQQLLDGVREQLVKAKAVVLSDYGKGLFISPELIQAILQDCRKKKIPVFIDPKGRDWEDTMAPPALRPIRLSWRWPSETMPRTGIVWHPSSVICVGNYPWKNCWLPKALKE